MKNPLQSLQDHGQSTWLDYIRRGLIASGGLWRLIEEDGLRGIPSNSVLFEKAIACRLASLPGSCLWPDKLSLWLKK
jgi:hypothetical protein